ncbi:hypothetical protein BC829DRAFT_127057 [Chytridium lagenaria]|nr:hypothetical protein BC829DRAFT_127057 [Chytridium lagenaria]
MRSWSGQKMSLSFAPCRLYTRVLQIICTNPHRLIYALASRVFTIKSVRPLGGRTPEYRLYDGTTPDDLLEFIISKCVEPPLNGRGRKRVLPGDCLRSVIDELNEMIRLHRGGYKDEMDNLVLSGMSKAGHFENQAKLVIPEHLRHGATALKPLELASRKKKKALLPGSAESPRKSLTQSLKRKDSNFPSHLPSSILLDASLPPLTMHPHQRQIYPSPFPPPLSGMSNVYPNPSYFNHPNYTAFSSKLSTIPYPMYPPSTAPVAESFSTMPDYAKWRKRSWSSLNEMAEAAVGVDTSNVAIPPTPAFPEGTFWNEYSQQDVKRERLD